MTDRNDKAAAARRAAQEQAAAAALKTVARQQQEATGAALHNLAQPSTAAHNHAQHSTSNKRLKVHDKLVLHPYDTQWGASSLNYEFSPEEYGLALWIAQNVPSHPSLRDVMRKALQLYGADMLQKHYKPESTAEFQAWLTQHENR